MKLGTVEEKKAEIEALKAEVRKMEAHHTFLKMKGHVKEANNSREAVLGEKSREQTPPRKNKRAKLSPEEGERRERVRRLKNWKNQILVCRRGERQLGL